MSQEAEQSTLGGIMIDNSRYHDIDMVADDFFYEIHQHIFQAIKALIGSGGAADIITVGEWLKQNTVVSSKTLAYMAELFNNTPSAANVPVYAEIVKKDARRRRALSILSEGLESVKTEGTDKIDQVISELMQLVDGNRRYECSVQDAVGEAAERLEWLSKHPGLVGLPTGLTELDIFLGGFQSPDLYVIGARPAMGKTALMLNMALAAGKPVGIFSAEQPKIQIGQRVIAISGGASTTNMRRGDMSQEDWSAVTTTMGQLKDRTIMINDKSSLTITDVFRQTRKWKREYDIKGIYLDFIQQMKGQAGDKRHEQIAEIARGLKELAKELDIAVIALAQVNRDVEKRSDKRPHMSDLLDSGVIEQAADNIMMLYRDEVYHKDTKTPGIAEINIVKNRHGRIGYIYTEWDPERMVFSNKKDTQYRFDE